MDAFHTKLPNHFDLPRRIVRLRELAYNLWWTWQPDAQRLFNRLDNDLWERLSHNPIRLLRELERSKLNDAAQDKVYVDLYDRVFRARRVPRPAEDLVCNGPPRTEFHRLLLDGIQRPCQFTRAAWACWRATT